METLPGTFRIVHVDGWTFIIPADYVSDQRLASHTRRLATSHVAINPDGLVVKSRTGTPARDSMM